IVQSCPPFAALPDATSVQLVTVRRRLPGTCRRLPGVVGTPVRADALPVLLAVRALPLEDALPVLGAVRAPLLAESLPVLLAVGALLLEDGLPVLLAPGALLLADGLPVLCVVRLRVCAPLRRVVPGAFALPGARPAHSPRAVV